MPDTLRLQAGESRQLRAPSGVGRWSSSAPGVVTTTDEDLVAGNPGGLLTGISPGRATISAFGFDNETAVDQWDVEVEAAGLATIQVRQNEFAALPGTPGVTHWRIANSRVAEILDGGRVRGLSPGITTAHALGDPPGTECSIEVTGALDASVNQSIALAEFFSCPVSSWRASTTEVPIDSHGTLRTGNRARTVVVTAQLASGKSFQFNVRIAGTARPEASVRDSTADRGTISVEPAVSYSSLETMRPDVAPPYQLAPADQRRMVEGHLRAAEAYLEADNWVQAGSELTAARLGAVTDPDLARSVDQMGERLRTAACVRAATAVAEAINLLLAGDYESASRRLDLARLPRDFTPLVDSVRRFARLCQQAQSDADLGPREALERELTNVWGEVVRTGAYSALPPLAEIGFSHGERVVSLLVNTLSNTAISGMSIEVRQSLGKLLAETDALALEAVIAKLIAPETPPAVAELLRCLLPDLNLQRFAFVVMKRYAAAAQAEQRLLVERLSDLAKSGPNSLLDLLSGVVMRLPPDTRLAVAVKNRVGADELERIAARWAVGHRGARTVLERLYDYPPSAF